MTESEPLVDAEATRYLARRRAVEVVVLIVLSPALGAVALGVAAAIRLDDGGPILFAQRRPGLHGRIFTLRKFRTMRAAPTPSAFMLTGEDDARVTGVGGPLRRLHLDELPQCWNVIRGDMSLLGPRPVPLEVYALYRQQIPHYDLRHLIRPGILGYAQIKLGYTADVAGERAKWALDMEYVSRVSWRLDAAMILAALRLRHLH